MLKCEQVLGPIVTDKAPGDRIPGSTEYRVPRFRDLPRMEIVLVDKKESESIGAGETPLIAVAPAMANAIFGATGQRVRSMPFQSEPAKA